MSIISGTQVAGHGALSYAPFCDYLNVSYPTGMGLLIRDELMPLVDSLGLTEPYPGLFRHGEFGGTLKFSQRSGVDIVSASGDLLAVLRNYGRLGEYLSLLASLPHRVTMLHASADFCAHGPRVIREVCRRGHAGDVRLTRKRVSPRAVKTILSLDARGEETGTVYFGHRANADVWAKVYDKRHEREEKGFADPGPLVRVEVAVQSDMCASLKDASDPSTLFYHLAVPTLVDTASLLSQWVPGGEGFAREPRREITPYQRLRSLMDLSPDITRMCNLARKSFGADAADVLSKLMAARVGQGSLLAAAA